MASGVQFGSTDWKRERSRPAAENNAAASGGFAALAGVSSTWGGTASNPTKRPCASNSTFTIPDISMAGSSSVTSPSLPKELAIKYLGLVRYQNRIGAG